MSKVLLICLVFCVTLITFDPVAAANDDLRKALTFHASFDQVVDADFALGNKQLYTATSYKKREDAKPGLHHPDVSLVPGSWTVRRSFEICEEEHPGGLLPCGQERDLSTSRLEWNGFVLA